MYSENHHNGEEFKKEMMLFGNMQEIYYDDKIKGKKITEYPIEYLESLEHDLKHFARKHPEYRRNTNNEIKEMFEGALSKLEKTLKEKSDK